MNQAVKAIAIARRFVAENGGDLYMVPGFIDVTIEGQRRTGVSIKVFLSEGKLTEE